MIKRADKPVRARPLRDISQKRRYVYGRYNPDRLYACGPRDVKNVLVIDAASRSGSSFLHSLLARHPDVISLNGEDIVFQKLHGLCAVASAKDSDLLPRDFRPGKDLAAAVAADILAHQEHPRIPLQCFTQGGPERFAVAGLHDASAFAGAGVSTSRVKSSTGSQVPASA